MSHYTVVITFVTSFLLGCGYNRLSIICSCCVLRAILYGGRNGVARREGGENFVFSLR